MSALSVLAIPRKRRRFSAKFKARIFEKCPQPGASVAGIALEHALNANLVHKWIRAACRKEPVKDSPAFIPMLMASTTAPMETQRQSVESIRLSSPSAQGTRTIEWPVSDCTGLSGAASGSAVVIRNDEIWLATEPLDMRAGPDTALARVVKVFGTARLHSAYLFAIRRGNRMKVPVHDGQGAGSERAGSIKASFTGPVTGTATG